MQPRRPDSAKSRITQKTLDTQLNQSKLAQTFTSYTTFHRQKKDEFIKYLQEKNKDPKFKKYCNTNLREIPQKPQQQLSKINSKPFEKRTAKVSQKPKIQSHKKEDNKQTDQKPNQKLTIKEQKNGSNKQSKVEMNSTSKSFAQKNRQKLNSISSGLKKVDGEKKMQLKGFKVIQRGQKQLSNRTGDKEEKDEQCGIQGGQKELVFNGPEQASRQQQKALNSTNKSKSNKGNVNTYEQQNNKQKQQEQMREQRLLQISQFINDVQRKNIDYYPSGYEEFVENQSARTSFEGLQMIDIKDFLVQPTESDYMKVRKLIKENQMRLDQEERVDGINSSSISQSRVSTLSFNNQKTNNKISNNKKQPNRQSIKSPTQSSINLDKIIDSSQIDPNEQQSKQEQQNQQFLSSISSKELKQRNVFLTEILKGRVTKQEINKLQEMNRSQMKWHKLQSSFNNNKQQQDSNDMEINMMKKQSNRVIQRNIIQASGQIYRDCDYLSEENKLRLERLLNGEMENSPFTVSEWERFALRRIDEGIRLYRQYSNNLNRNQQQNHNQFTITINQQLLPKDPILRKQAERKILKQKLNAINARLQQIQSAVITQNQIQQQVKQYSHLPPSQFTQSFIQQRNLQIIDIEQKTKIAIQMLAKAEDEKSAIQSALQQMEEQLLEYAKQCKQYEKLTVQQIVNKQRQQLEDKKTSIKEIEESMKMIQRDTQQWISQFHNQLSSQIQILREIEDMSNIGNSGINARQLMGNMTMEELDAMFEKKMEENMEIQLMKSRMNENQMSKVEQEQQNNNKENYLII